MNETPYEIYEHILEDSQRETGPISEHEIEAALQIAMREMDAESYGVARAYENLIRRLHEHGIEQ